MIKIIEKEPYKNFDNWNNRECLMYPTMMIKDGKEHFIFNRREPDAEYQEKENQKRIEILKRTDGKYTMFYGKYENPFEMLREIIKEKDLIITNSQDIFDRRMTNEESIDFHGNRENYSSAFMYRIYDKKLENALKEIVEYINKKDNKKIKNKLTLGSVIVSPYANSLIKKQYTKLFNLIFDPNELNMRNNIAHINNESSDYLCLGDTAVLMQLLWDIITEDIFE